LLYYAQAYSLGIRNKPIFSDSIEAWRHGPVVPSLVDFFQPFDSIFLTSFHFNYDQPLSLEDQDFIEGIWHTFKYLSNSGLSGWIKSEEPWKNAYDRWTKSNYPDKEIKSGFLAAYYGALGLPDSNQFL
jgi:uncharacterized phage-associated protein